MEKIFDLTITDVAYLGSGVGRHDGCVIFVPGAFTGEIVDVQVTWRKKKFARAKILEIKKPHPARLFENAIEGPGVTYGSIKYEEEVKIKQNQLANFLTRMAGLDTTKILKNPVASPIELNYRNKIVLHVGEKHGKRVLGYLGEDNKTIIDTEYCPLACPEINKKLVELRRDGPFMRKLHSGENVTLRYTKSNGVIYWVDRPPQGIDLTESTVLGELTVPAGGFFQVNLSAADLLLTAFKELFSSNDVPKSYVIDLYCGSGLFSVAAAQVGAEEIFGIEHVSGAISSARKNARKHNIKQAFFSCADSEALTLAELKKKPSNETTLIVDPPRDGISDLVLAKIFQAPPQVIFYISCGPDTLVRDLKKLTEFYEVESVQLFDFFPRTVHFETLTYLKRKE